MPVAQDLAAVFHLPSSQAAQSLGCGLTIFKLLCRKLGLRRWPYRSLKKQVSSGGDVLQLQCGPCAAALLATSTTGHPRARACIPYAAARS